MGFLDRFFQRRQTPALSTAQIDSLIRSEIAKAEIRGIPNLTYGTNGQQSPSFGAYQQLRLTVVWRCVSIIAGAISGIPCRFYKVDDESTEEMLPQPGNLPYLLQVRPNNFQTIDAFYNHLNLSLLLRGEAMIFKQRNQGGEIVELIPLNPDSVIVTFDNVSGVKTYSAWGQIYTDADIVHILGNTIDGIRGVSPFLAFYGLIDNAVKQETYTNHFYTRGGVPVGIITPNVQLDDDTVKAAKDKWNTQVSGIERSHSTAFLPFGWKYEPIAIKPEDMQLVQSRQFTVEELARVFGVPLSKLNVPMPSQKIDTENDDLNFLKYTIDPILVKFESAFRIHFVEPMMVGQMLISFDRDAFIQTDRMTFVGNLINMTNAGIMTRNEARKKLKLNPKPGLDSIQIQQGFAMIDGEGNIIPMNKPEMANAAKMMADDPGATAEEDDL